MMETTTTDWNAYDSIIGLMVWCPDCTISYDRMGVESAPLSVRAAWDLACQPGGLRCDECGRRA